MRHLRWKFKIVMVDAGFSDAAFVCVFRSGLEVSCWSKIISSVIVGGDGRVQNGRFGQMENPAVFKINYIPVGQRVYVWANVGCYLDTVLLMVCKKNLSVLTYDTHVYTMCMHKMYCQIPLYP